MMILVGTNTLLFFVEGEQLDDKRQEYLMGIIFILTQYTHEIGWINDVCIVGKSQI
jgi:hypothetical protein